MNFKINKKEFLEALNITSKAISSTTPLPALSGIKFELTGNELTLISSDSNISIKVVINNSNNEIITIEEPGEIVIEAKYILDIVRKIDSSSINIEVIDGTLVKIYGGNSEFKLNCIKASDYPMINFSTSDNIFKLDSSIFKDIINQTAFACSDKEIKPVLTGINFQAGNGKLRVNATDSLRLATKTLVIEDGIEFNITIPAKYLLNVYHSIDENIKEINMMVDTQKVSFSFNNILIQTRLLDDAFPEVSKLIPPSFSQTLVINAKELSSAIDRSSFIKSDGKNVVKLSINSESVDITSSNQNSSSFENIKVISFEGEPINISCSGNYLQDAIKALDSENITISFSGELKPMILTNSEDTSIVQLIAPIRTYR